MALCCSRAVSGCQVQLADDDVKLPGPDPAAGVMSRTYLGVIWAIYTADGNCYAHIEHMITRSQIAYYLCTSWTTTSAPEQEFLARGMHLRVRRWDGERYTFIMQG